MLLMLNRLMLLAMLSLNGVLKRRFGSNGLMLSSDTFLFMLLPCLGLSSPPPTLILKLGGYFWASNTKSKGNSIPDLKKKLQQY